MLGHTPAKDIIRYRHIIAIVGLCIFWLVHVQCTFVRDLYRHIPTLLRNIRCPTATYFMLCTGTVVTGMSYVRARNLSRAILVICLYIHLVVQL